MDSEITEIIQALRKRIEDMLPNERVSVWFDITEGYCEFCGGDKVPCHCENDE